jgi:hypothetical protein
MFVSADPAAMTTAAAGLETVGSSVTAGNAAAAAPTMGVLAPSLDETGALMALSFATHGATYQAAAAVATAWHQMMVAMLGTNAGSYVATEAANAVASL